MERISTSTLSVIGFDLAPKHANQLFNKYNPLPSRINNIYLVVEHYYEHLEGTLALIEEPTVHAMKQ